MRNAALCGLLAVAAALAATPFVEMGVCDDWSYIKTARDLAETDRFQYNGWATAMLGGQALVGAAAIRLFGFSFTIVRLTTLLFAAGCAVLSYALGRRAGLLPVAARFATLGVLALSPVFVPLAASFMTDIPGLFFFLLAVYAGVRALSTPPARWGSFTGWLVLSVIAGLAGGTVRQAVWEAPLALLGFLTWQGVRGVDRRRAAIAAVCLMVTVAGAAWCTAWFRQQPYAIADSPPAPEGIPGRVFAVLWYLLLLLPTLSLLLLPVLALVAPAWQGAGERRVRAYALALAVAVPALLYGLQAAGGLIQKLPRTVAEAVGSVWPYWGDIVPVAGPFHNYFELGERAAAIPLPLRGPLVAATLFPVFLALYAAFARRSSNGGESTARKGDGVTALYLTITVGYLALLFGRKALVSSWLFDRYLLPILPLLAILLLRRWQEERRAQKGNVPEVKAAAWAALALFGAYAVAATQLHFATARARLLAVDLLRARGIPRTAIAAGFDFDGWTQLEAEGYINDSRLRLPPGAYRGDVSRGNWPENVPYWSKTPAVRPMYFVVVGRLAGFTDTELPPVTFTTWLPPFRRAVFIQAAPGAETFPDRKVEQSR